MTDKRQTKKFHIGCSNHQIHTVYVGKNGHVSIPQHCLNAELAMHQMSGLRVSACALVICRLRGWHNVRGLYTATFPVELRTMFLEANKKRDDRRRARSKDPWIELKRGPFTTTELLVQWSEDLKREGGDYEPDDESGTP